MTRIYLFWCYLLLFERIYILFSIRILSSFIRLCVCMCVRVCVHIYMHDLSSSQDQLKILSEQSNGFQQYA